MIDREKNATQNAQVLAHLKAGNSVTQRDAILFWNCYRLGARIYDLRQEGYEIAASIDKKTGHAVYSLVVTAPAQEASRNPERARSREQQPSLF